MVLMGEVKRKGKDLKRKWFLEIVYQLNRKLNLVMIQVYVVVMFGMFFIQKGEKLVFEIFVMNFFVNVKIIY